MVQVQRHHRNTTFKKIKPLLITAFGFCCWQTLYLLLDRGNSPQINTDPTSLSNNAINEVTSHGEAKVKNRVEQVSLHAETAPEKDANVDGETTTILPTCQYKSISDLESFERYPKASQNLDGNGRRHMVDPPADDHIALVCCETTAGPLAIAVHKSWARIGANNFLEMVRSNYFSSRVALMRCVKNFICQFGIAGNPELNKEIGTLQDDKNWLPEGPDYRTNQYGVKRFARGYMAYAGSGKNSRGNQLIMALGDNPRLGGGSPWEVPWGEIVGKDSYDTLTKIYTGYGEKGPNQGLLRREGSSSKVRDQFPNLDYITSCTVLDMEEV